MQLDTDDAALGRFQALDDEAGRSALHACCASPAWGTRVWAGQRTREEPVDANRAYEERFGHVFLIRWAGRSAAEILAELRRRLGDDPATERLEVVDQLAQITRLRAGKLLDS